MISGLVKIKCNSCDLEGSENDFYTTTIKGKVYIRKQCKDCHNAGIKSKYIRKKKIKPIKPIKPVKEEVVSKLEIEREKKRLEQLKLKRDIDIFINEMDVRKRGYFDMVDCYRLIDIFTLKYGVIYTDLDIEDELLFMWGKLKENNFKFEV